MAKQLFTIGYEGRTIEAFLRTLKQFSIKLILDVREVPISRKPGFSKSALARSLAKERIRYVHLRELGSPCPTRKALRLTGNYEAFFEEMNMYLDQRKDLIETAHGYAIRDTCCLMCFERAPARCHRRLVAEKLARFHSSGLRITHI